MTEDGSDEIISMWDCTGTDPGPGDHFFASCELADDAKKSEKKDAVFVHRSLKLEELNPCGSGISTAGVRVGRKCHFSSLSAK